MVLLESIQQTAVNVQTLAVGNTILQLRIAFGIVLNPVSAFESGAPYLMFDNFRRCGFTKFVAAAMLVAAIVTAVLQFNFLRLLQTGRFPALRR